MVFSHSGQAGQQDNVAFKLLIWDVVDIAFCRMEITETGMVGSKLLLFFQHPCSRQKSSKDPMTQQFLPILTDTTSYIRFQASGAAKYPAWKQLRQSCAQDRSFHQPKRKPVKPDKRSYFSRIAKGVGRSLYNKVPDRIFPLTCMSSAVIRPSLSTTVADRFSTSCNKAAVHNISLSCPPRSE